MKDILNEIWSEIPKWARYVFMGILFLILASLMVTSCFFLKEDDNVIEEVLEEMIKQESGTDVDLTPDSPEKK